MREWAPVVGIGWLMLSCGPTCEHAGGYTWVGGQGYSQEYIDDSSTPAIEILISRAIGCTRAVSRPYAPEAYCLDQTEPPCRDCLQLLVTTQWDWSCDGQEQLLRVEAPGAGCRQKGFEADLDCPCRFRGGTIRSPDRHHNLVIVTPNLRMLRAEVVRYWSGCWDVWRDSRLARCANPEGP